MPAVKEKRLNTLPNEPGPQVLGVIAGGGDLPAILLHACDEKGIEPFVVAFEDQTDPAVVQGRKHIWTRIGAAGHILEVLKQHEIRDLVLIGSVRRPSIFDLRPDLKTVQFFAKLGFKALGDDGLLGALRQELEGQGFLVRGVQEFADELLAPSGPLGRYKPAHEDWADIDRGLEVSRMLGAADVGQAVIVQEGIVLGVEAAEGTDDLIDRCAPLKRKGRRGVLVKTCKPQQDQRLDLPAIGPQTIMQMDRCGLGGLVILAGRTLVINRPDVIRLADEKRIFILAVEPLF